MTIEAGSPQQRLEERYGRTRGQRKWPWVALIVVVAVIVGVYGWSVLSDPGNSVRADDTAFELVGQHSVRVSFQLSAPPGTTVVCTVEALDEEHGVVGWRVIEFPASDQHTRAFTETVPTVAEATTGLVNSCRVA